MEAIYQHSGPDMHALTIENTIDVVNVNKL